MRTYTATGTNEITDLGITQLLLTTNYTEIGEGEWFTGNLASSCEILGYQGHYKLLKLSWYVLELANMFFKCPLFFDYSVTDYIVYKI